MTPPTASPLRQASDVSPTSDAPPAAVAHAAANPAPSPEWRFAGAAPASSGDPQREPGPTPSSDLSSASFSDTAKRLFAVASASLKAWLRNLLGQDDLDFASTRLGWERRRPPLRSYVLISSVFVFFLVAAIWAHWAVLDEVTSGEGRVIPSSQVQVVQNLEGGIVKDILVHEGDVVEKNQVLLNIDNSTFTASLGEMRAKYYGLMAAIARLTAETDPKQKAPQFPPELLAEEPKVAQSEQALYLARQSQLQAQMAVFQQQARQHEQELAEAKSKAQHLQDSISLVKQEIAINRPLVATGVVAKVDQLKLERQLNELTGDMQAAVLATPRIEAAVREANQRVEETYLSFQSDAQQQLAKNRTEFKAVSDSLAAAKDRVQRTEVRSPVKGIIKQLKVTTIGGVIKPGQDLVDIVPLDDTLLIEAKIRPRDIAFIRPNQEATVKFTAYDFAIYGGLKAKVERISADAIEDNQSPTGRPETYYKVILRTASNHLGSVQKPLPIIPGMIASVDILTGKKTVLDYLLKPILRGREKAMHER